VLVEAAWHAERSYGPLRVFAERIAAKRGVQVATVAVGRKLVVFAWQGQRSCRPLRMRVRPTGCREAGEG
jgi:hypothetical protein